MLVRIDRSLLEPGCPSGALPPRSQPRCRSASDRGIGTRAGSVACRLASPTHRARLSGALAPTRGSGSSSSTTNAVSASEDQVVARLHGNARAGGQPRREGGHHAGERHEQASDLGAPRPRGAAGLPRSRSPARQLAFASTERGQALYSRIGTHWRTRPTAVRQGACRADRRSDGAGSRFGTPARRDTTPARAFQIPSLICGRGQRFKSSTHQQFPCVKRVRRDPRLRSRRPIGPIDQRSPRKVSRSTE